MGTPARLPRGHVLSQSALPAHFPPSVGPSAPLPSFSGDVSTAPVIEPVGHAQTTHETSAHGISAASAAPAFCTAAVNSGPAPTNPTAAIPTSPAVTQPAPSRPHPPTPSTIFLTDTESVIESPTQPNRHQALTRSKGKKPLMPEYIPIEEECIKLLLEGRKNKPYRHWEDLRIVRYILDVAHPERAVQAQQKVKRGKVPDVFDTVSIHSN